MWGYVAAMEATVIGFLVGAIWASTRSFKKLLGLINAAGWRRPRADRQAVHGPNVYPFGKRPRGPAKIQ